MKKKRDFKEVQYMGRNFNGVQMLPSQNRQAPTLQIVGIGYWHTMKKAMWFLPLTEQNH